MLGRLSSPDTITVSVPRSGSDRKQFSLPTIAAGDGSERLLKLLLAVVFLPEGFSFFIGDARLTPARGLLLALVIVAIVRFLQRVGSSRFAFIPSDLFAALTGIWMVTAAIANSGFDQGLKGGGALALEFVGAYYVFRNLLGSADSSVRIVRFASKLLVVIVALALLDPLTGRLFTYDLVKSLTGYVKPIYETVFEDSSAYHRYGLVRAMGPLEHSILFGTVCAWFGTLALMTFPSGAFGKTIAAIAIVGVVAALSAGPLIASVLAGGLIMVYFATPELKARWR